MESIKSQFARKLMDIKAIKLQPQEPFTWASGWKSPIYTDNRKTLGFPSLRSFVKLALCHTIQEQFPEAEAVAGVATGAIAQGALVADELGLPYCYVRPKPKDHGMGNQVEGELPQGAKVVVVEDLISTGGSSLKAVAALRQANVNVLGMVAIFTYQMELAKKNFEEKDCQLVTLSNYETLIQKAVEEKYVTEEDVQSLKEWRKDQQAWSDQWN
jgi:orotate phosphoribosyltransferase